MLHFVFVLYFSGTVYVLSFIFLFFSFLSFTLYIAFKCLLLHVYALSCNSILEFLCSRCCVTLLLEMYVVKLMVRTFYKLLAFSLGLLLHRIPFCVFYFCTVDTWCNKKLLAYLLSCAESKSEIDSNARGGHTISINSEHGNRLYRYVFLDTL